MGKSMVSCKISLKPIQSPLHPYISCKVASIPITWSKDFGSWAALHIGEAAIRKETLLNYLEVTDFAEHLQDINI